MSILSVYNLCKSFKDHNNIINAVSNVSFDVEYGEMVAIIGPSGSGKTTLLNLIGVVLMPDSGEIYIEGKLVNEMTDKQCCQIRNKYFGYIVQDFALIEDETAMKNILVPTLYSEKKRKYGDYKEDIYEMATRLHIKDKLNTVVNKLSGGERQRIAVIRSLICNQSIILADEPTGSLDKENSQLVIDFLKEKTRTGNHSIIIVTHDLNVARQCDRVIQINRGKLEEITESFLNKLG